MVKLARPRLAAAFCFCLVNIALAQAPAPVTTTGPAAKHFAKGYDLLKGGDADSAVDELKEGLKLQPGNAMAWFYLGQARLKLGSVELAKTAFEKSLVLDPNGKASDSAAKELAKLNGSSPPPGQSSGMAARGSVTNRESTPVSGAFVGEGVAPDTVDQSSSSRNNTAKFVLNLLGRDGDSIKAVLEVLSSNRQDERDNGVVSRTTLVRRYYSRYLLQLTPDIGDPHGLEARTCSVAGQYDIDKYIPSPEADNQPLSFRNLNMDPAGCFPGLPKFTFSSDTEVKLSVTVLVYNSQVPFNVTLKAP